MNENENKTAESPSPAPDPRHLQLEEEAIVPGRSHVLEGGGLTMSPPPWLPPPAPNHIPGECFVCGDPACVPGGALCERCKETGGAV
jgi:hypothetical protein